MKSTIDRVAINLILRPVNAFQLGQNDINIKISYYTFLTNKNIGKDDYQPN